MYICYTCYNFTDLLLYMSYFYWKTSLKVPMELHLSFFHFSYCLVFIMWEVVLLKAMEGFNVHKKIHLFLHSSYCFYWFIFDNILVKDDAFNMSIHGWVTTVARFLVFLYPVLFILMDHTGLCLFSSKGKFMLLEKFVPM